MEKLVPQESHFKNTETEIFYRQILSFSLNRIHSVYWLSTYTLSTQYHRLGVKYSVATFAATTRAMYTSPGVNVLRFYNVNPASKGIKDKLGIVQLVTTNSVMSRGNACYQLSSQTERIFTYWYHFFFLLLKFPLSRPYLIF